MLVAFHGAGSGALGAGVSDEAGQRLVGAHLLLLVPVYLFIAWRPARYPELFWLPFAGQAIIVISVSYGILRGDTGFGNGILAVFIGLFFCGALGYIWVLEQRTAARQRLNEEPSPPSDDAEPPFRDQA